MNQVTLIGNLGRDPEFRKLESGTPVCRFSVATNETYKDKNGETQKLTEWHEVVAWRDQAEIAEKSLRKGSSVFIEGKLSHRKYTDANGIDRKITEVIANTIGIVEKKELNNAPFPTQEPLPKAKETAPVAQSVATDKQGANSSQPEPEDDLPF